MTRTKRLLLLGLGLFVVGIVLIPFGILLPILKQPVKEIQFLGPGKSSLSIEEGGRYFIWNEYHATLDGMTYVRAETLPSSFELRIQNEAGHTLPWLIEESASVEKKGHAKTVLGYVDGVEAGKLSIEIKGDLEPRVFSLSQSNFQKYIHWIVGGAILSTLIALIGAGITLRGIYFLAKQSTR